MTADRPGDHGTTLVEVTVAMLVFGIFAALLSTTVLQGTRQTRESSVRELTLQRASTLMQQLTKDLRSAVRVGPAADATAFRKAEADRVDFTSSVTDILLETLCARASCDTPLPSQPGLYRYVRPPDAASVYPELTYTGTTSTARRLEDDQLTTAALFRYDVRKPDPVTGVLTTTTGLASVPAADLKHISAVHVLVRLDGDGAGRLPPVELASTVRPYNP